LLTLVQRYVAIKLEVSTAFLFQENWRHATDGRSATLAAPYEGPHKKNN